MSEILLRAEDARTAASSVTSTASDVLSQFQSLKTALAPLGDSFRGKTATAWDTKYAELDKSGNDLMDALEGLGKFLRGAADAIESADNDLAAQLAG